MNHLKHMLAFNVPRRVPSNAAIATRNGPQSVTCFKRRPSKPRLLKSDRSILLRTKRSYDFGDVQQASHHVNRDATRIVDRKGVTTYPEQRYKAKPTVTCSRRHPVERRTSTECVHRHCNRHPTTQVMRFSTNTNKRYSRPDSELLRIRRSSKDLASSKGTLTHFGALHETEPRSYAQMIADYSETLYARSSSGIFSDSSVASTGYRICRSPFSTLSTTTTRERSAESRSTILRKNSPKAFNQGLRFSSKNSNSKYDCRTGHRNCVEPLKRSSFETTVGSLERVTRSYAKMIAQYSDAMYSRTDTHLPRNASASRRNLETFGNLTTTSCQSKDANGKIVGNGVESSNNEGHGVEPKKQVGWRKRVENVVTDLRQVAVSKDAKEIASTLKEKQSLYSINDYAHWLDRVVTAHRRKCKDNGATLTQMSEVQPSNERDKHKVFPAKLETSDMQQFSNYGKSSNSSFAQPQNRVPINSGAPSKGNLTQTPMEMVPNSSKVPKVELKMSPSQNESVVSINVGEVPFDAAGHFNHDMKELFVTVRSNRSNNSKAEKNRSSSASSFTMHQSPVSAQPIAPSRFGSMHISITENSVPVKQIQFSINGKPISDLKSIIARTDKLDVVSSLDKVEIRIPFSEKNNAVPSTKIKDVAQGARSAEPMLNLEISAKFEEPRAERTAETYLRAETKSVLGSKRTETLSTQNVIKAPDGTNLKEGGSPNQSVNQRTDIITENVVGNTERPTKITKAEKFEASGLPVKSNEVTNENIQLSRNTMRSSETLEGSRPEVQNSEYAFKNTEINIPDKKTPKRSSINVDKQNKSELDDQRVPSNMIPWWSSEDSFNKIRKKGNTEKALSASPTATEENIKSAEKVEKPASFVQPKKPEREARSITTNPRTEMNLTKENIKQDTKEFSGFSRIEMLKMTRAQRLRKWEYLKPIVSNSRVSKHKTKQQSRSTISEFVKTELQHPNTKIRSTDKNTGKVTKTAVDEENAEKRLGTEVKKKGASVVEVKTNSTLQKVSNESKTENVNGSEKNDSNTALKFTAHENASASDLTSSNITSGKTFQSLRQSPRSIEKVGQLSESPEKLTSTSIAAPNMKTDIKEEQKPIGETRFKNVTNYFPEEEAIDKKFDTCRRVKKYTTSTNSFPNNKTESIQNTEADFRSTKDAVESPETSKKNLTRAETKSKRTTGTDSGYSTVSVSKNIKSNKKTDEDNSLKKGKSTEVVSSPNLGIKDIVESMKPIEKRKDGTLIDYGVKVSTRNTLHSPDSKLHEDRRESPVNLEVRNVTSNTLTQCNNTPKEVKQIEMDDAVESTLKTKVGKTVALSKTCSEKHVSEAASEKKNSSKISPPISPLDRSSSNKTSSSSDTAPMKHSIEISSPNLTKELSKTSEPTVQGKTPPKEIVCENTPLKSVQTNNSTASSFPKTADLPKHVKPQNSPSAPNSESASSKEMITPSTAETKDKKMKSKRDSRPFNVFHSSAPSRLSSLRKSAKLRKTERASFEGSLSYRFPYGAYKKISNTDVPPPSGTLISQGSKTSDNKPGSQKAPPVVSATSQSVRVLNKDTSSTGMAPLAGTIVHRPSKKPSKLVSGRTQASRRNEPGSMDIGQSSVSSTSRRDKMNLGEDSVDHLEPGSSDVPTGPAGLKPQSVGSRVKFKSNSNNNAASLIRSTASKQEFNKKTLNTREATTKKKSNDVSGAKRFTSNVDDDEIP